MTYRTQAARGQHTVNYRLAALPLIEDEIVRPELCNDAILAANSAASSPRGHAAASATHPAGR